MKKKCKLIIITVNKEIRIINSCYESCLAELKVVSADSSMFSENEIHYSGEKTSNHIDPFSD